MRREHLFATLVVFASFALGVVISENSVQMLFGGLIGAGAMSFTLYNLYRTHEHREKPKHEELDLP